MQPQLASVRLRSAGAVVGGSTNLPTIEGAGPTATTNPALAIAAVDALSHAGIEFAVLHREDEVANGRARSDVDIVVGDPPIYAIAAAANEFASVGLSPIIWWPYDVGGTGTVMLASSEGSDGVQLDFLHDPAGDGQDGVRSAVLLDSRIPGHRWAKLDPTHEYLYLVRKRDRKGDISSLRQLLDNPPSPDTSKLEAAARTIFRPDIASRVADLLRGLPRAEQSRQWVVFRRRGEAARWLDRIRRPVGLWANVSGPGDRDLAIALADRFGAYLPRSGTGPRPHGLSAWTWPRRVGSIRWRAGLIVSWGPSVGRPQADLELHTSEGVDGAGERVVASMQQRVRRRIPVDWDDARRGHG